jgi:hypothetical protein
MDNSTGAQDDLLHTNTSRVAIPITNMLFRAALPLVLLFHGLSSAGSLFASAVRLIDHNSGKSPNSLDNLPHSAYFAHYRHILCTS